MSRRQSVYLTVREHVGEFDGSDARERPEKRDQLIQDLTDWICLLLRHQTPEEFGDVSFLPKAA